MPVATLAQEIVLGAHDAELDDLLNAIQVRKDNLREQAIVDRVLKKLERGQRIGVSGI